MAEAPAVKREIHHNARWALYETERAGADGTKQLLMVFSQAEVARVGLANLHKRFELFQKLHTAIGKRVLYATHLLPSYDKVAVAFSVKSKKKLALIPGQSKLPSPVPVSPTGAHSPSHNESSKDTVLPSFYSLLTRIPIHQISDYLATAINIIRIFWEIHRQGMVHNGICMQGLLVRPGGLPKVHLADMGDLREGVKNTFNTPEDIGDKNVDIDFYKYTSPESTGRTGNAVDQRADIYSLGVLLYELAAGTPPFVSNDPLELIQMHMTQAAPPLPSDLWSSEQRVIVDHISKILQKMMEKEPRARYQSLYGVVRDFETISRCVQRKSSFSSFAVSAHDLRDEFHLPDLKLYGREREVVRVIQFMEQFCATRDTAVVLVGGASGVGKSSLVRKVLETAYTRYAGSATPGAKPPIMLTGKHDRIKHTPYSAVLEAYSEIVRRVLMTEGTELQMWRDELMGTLSPNGQVLVDVIPEIEAVIGPQPPVPVLPPTENKSRFQRVLISFMQVFLAHHPAILFLDDMQWADPSTISLVEALASDTTVNNLIIICAYRDNEINNSHLFKMLIDTLQRKSPASMLSVTLSPLSIDHTTQLVMDSFHCEHKEAARSLAELAQLKTGGNPFFLGQFLTAMTQEKLIQFNYSTHEWEWSLAQLQSVEYTENIVEFLLQKVRKLPPGACDVARLAACLGNRFDLLTLATVAQMTPENVELLLTECIDSGFVNTYGPTDGISLDSANKNYKFVHDRVQEAFYALMDIQQRMETHLTIARLLKQKGHSDQESLFTIAHHYSLASEIVAKLAPEDPERSQLLDITLEAGKKAKYSSAVQAAINFFRTGRKMLIPDSIKTDYTRTFELLCLLADCEYICGHQLEAESLFSFLKLHAATDADRVRVLLMIGVSYESSGNYRKSVETNVEAVQVYKLDMTMTVTTEQVREVTEEVLKLKNQMISDNYAVLDLVNILPKMDAHNEAIMEVLYAMISSSYIIGDGLNLFNYIIALGCKLTLQHGISPVSANSFACFSGALSKGGQWADSYQFSKLALKLQEVYRHPLSLPRVELNVQAFGQWQQESLNDCKENLIRAFRHSLETGDNMYSLYIALNATIVFLGCGEHLDDCEATCIQWLNALRNMQLNQKIVNVIFGYSRALRVLKGGTQVLGKFNDDFDLAEHKRDMEAIDTPFFSAFTFTCSMITSTIFEDYDTAFLMCKSVSPASIEGLFVWYEYTSWYCLLSAVSIPTSFFSADTVQQSTAEHAAKVAEIREAVKKLQVVENSPSLASKIALIRAELARVEGKFAKAQELYQVAIEAARTVAYLPIIAFANEQAMKFYLAKKLDRVATSHFREARAAYFSWGAYAKCKQLETKYSFLMYGSGAAPLPSSITSTRGLDLASVLRAYQVISSEIDLNKLVGNMINIVIQNSGAQKGFFIVPDASGRLFIEAYGEAGVQEVQQMHLDIGSTSQAGTETFQQLARTRSLTASPTPTEKEEGTDQAVEQTPERVSQPYESPSKENLLQFLSPAQRNQLLHSASGSPLPNSPSGGVQNSPSGGLQRNLPPIIPAGIVQYVNRTKTCVLLDDACKEGMFTYEPHVQANKTKSVVCVPVINQSKVVAILYLENNMMTGAFTAERLELVQLLSSQVGISYENAALYKNLQSANALLEKKNRELLELDHIKDQFLANTSHELRTPLNGIIGLAESLIDGSTGDLTPSTCNNLAMIVNSGRRLANLVNDILDLSALKAGGLVIHPHPTNLKKTLNEVMFLSNHLVGLKELRLVDNTSEFPYMNLDEARIQQVLQNLIGNAIKFTHKGLITITSKVSDDWVDLSVSDTGCGIPASEFESIFEDFKQVDGSSSREIGGTGLGLSIARRLIEMHNGTITVESEVGKGSTFTIHLPLSLKLETLNGHLPIMHSEGKWSTHSHKNYQQSAIKTTILSVDDDPTNQVVVNKLLAAHFNVIQAMSGAEALDIISNSSKPPDFVLLDVMMPKMSGLEVCEKVREKFPMCDLPIIMVSAKNQPHHVIEGLRKGANDYMSKPLNKDELLARIHAQLMICHSCRMVCKGASIDDPFFVCDTCKQTRTKAGSRRSSLDFVNDLVNDLPNTFEILTHVPFGITLYSLEGRALLRNAEARRLYDNLPSIDVSQQTSQFLPHVLDRATAETILSDAKQGCKFEKNVEVYSPDVPVYHRIFSKSITLSIPQQNLIGSYILVVESDITEWWLKREEASRLRAAEHHKTELIFDLAHNLKAPLSGLAALAQDTNVQLQPAQIASFAFRMIRLVDEIADYTEATNVMEDSTHAKNVPIHILELVDTVDTLFIPTYRSKGVTVLRETPASHPPPSIIYTQPHKLTLLLTYLLDVSIHFSRSRVIRMRACTGVDEATAVVSFCDHQRSCTQEELEAMFSQQPVNGYLAPVIARKVADALGVNLTFTPNAQGGSSINAIIPETCLTGAYLKERRGSRRLSTSRPYPRRSHSSSPSFGRKDRMETIPEISESPYLNPPAATEPLIVPLIPSEFVAPQPSLTTPTLDPNLVPSVPTPALTPSLTAPSPNSQGLPLIPQPLSISPLSSPLSFPVSPLGQFSHMPRSPKAYSVPHVPPPPLTALPSSPTAKNSPPAAITYPTVPPPNLSIDPTTPSITPQPSPPPQTSHAFSPPKPSSPRTLRRSRNQPSSSPSLIPLDPIPTACTTVSDLMTYLVGEPDGSLEKEIKHLNAKLQYAQALYNTKKIGIKFKRSDDVFFHKVNIENPSIEQMRKVISKRLKLDPTQSMLIVRDGDTLVEADEDVEDGMVLDVVLN